MIKSQCGLADRLSHNVESSSVRKQYSSAGAGLMPVPHLIVIFLGINGTMYLNVYTAEQFLVVFSLISGGRVVVCWNVKL